ncbi:MAG: hypothetical protein AAF280_12705 [Pseudomonadota bacterium]
MTGDRLPTAVRPAGALVDLVQESPAARLPADLRARLIPFVEARPNWDGVVILGDQAVHHWVHISAGEAISMMGFLTPGLIASLGGGEVPDMEALSDTMSRPERLAAQLRAAQVAGDRAALTSHLIGAELAAAKMYWLGQEVVALGSGPYAEALKAQGVSVLER